MADAVIEARQGESMSEAPVASSVEAVVETVEEAAQEKVSEEA